MSPNGPVEREDAVGDAGVDHAGDRVVPEVLLVGACGRPRCRRRRVLAHEVAGVAAADAGGLHAAVGGEVGGAERQALHAGAGGADLLDVGDAPGRLEDGVDEQRPVEPGLGLELGEQPVDVVDVLGPLDLGDHDDVELVADLGDRGDEVVEAPRRVERVDPGPQLGVAEGRRSCRPRPGRPGRPPCRAAGTPSSRLASSTSTVGAMSGTLATIFGFDAGKKWIIRDGRTGISRTGSGAPTASGRKKSFGERMATP